ncbi:MAG: hypothetical protein EBY35_03470 [Rhodobacteraceae bacterium]|nr:hypothetical protein [Paracoccaceae bacterium]
MQPFHKKFPSERSNETGQFTAKNQKKISWFSKFYSLENPPETKFFLRSQDAQRLFYCRI